VGYQTPSPYGGYSETPYTDYLAVMTRAELQKRENDNLNVFFINKGINGDSTDGMLGRFTTSVEYEKPEYTIIWGGINDLFGGRRPSDVLENLKKLYLRVNKIESISIACTLTPVEGPDFINQRIRELNQIIPHHCDLEGIRWVDLFSALVDCNGRLESRFSNDGAHLTSFGYQMVAQTIFEEAVSYILDEFDKIE
jgi:lysophospholipase L1-like esterase